MAVLNKSSMFANGIDKLCTGAIDWDTDTIKAILMKQSFVGTTFNETTRDGYDFVDDIASADRAKSTFKAIGTNDSNIDAANDNVDFGGGTVSITFPTVTSGNECGGIVIFKSSGTEASSPLICFNKFASTITADGGTVTVTINTDGIFRASYD